MSDEKALLAAIWEHPHEDTPRLMYADWLDEHEQAPRAEFIRVQCERARLDEWDDIDRIDALSAREAELWKPNVKGWKADLPKSLQTAPFRRGFVYPRQLGLSAHKFLKLKLDALDAAPQWSANISSFVRQFGKVFTSPLLVRFDNLNIYDGKYSHDVLEKLADNDRLRNVSDLFISCAKGTPASVAAFFGGPATASLRKLMSWGMTHEKLAALRHSGAAARLVDLWCSLVGADGSAGAVFSANAFPNLRSLGVRSDHRWERQGEIVRLITADPTARLRKLTLKYAGVTNEGIERLAAWPGLANLRSLDLDDNNITEGYLALARSPHAGNLKELNVDGYWLRDLPAVKAELDARFGPAVHYV